MLDVSVQDILLTDFKQETGNDIIKIELLAEQVDQIADAKTDRVILESSKLIKERLYELTFIRKTGTSEWLLLNLVRIENKIEFYKTLQQNNKKVKGNKIWKKSQKLKK